MNINSLAFLVSKHEQNEQYVRRKIYLFIIWYISVYVSVNISIKMWDKIEQNRISDHSNAMWSYLFFWYSIDFIMKLDRNEIIS